MLKKEMARKMNVMMRDSDLIDRKNGFLRDSLKAMTESRDYWREECEKECIRSRVYKDKIVELVCPVHLTP
jgi:hypothetical protein